MKTEKKETAQTKAAKLEAAVKPDLARRAKRLFCRYSGPGRKTS